MAYTTTRVFGPYSSYLDYVTVVARTPSGESVEIQLELEDDDWETVHELNENGDRAVKLFVRGLRFRVAPSVNASYAVFTGG